MNIALFGGSFDPPHIGHEIIIQSIVKKLDIDKLIVMPTHLNPFKNKSHFQSDIRLDLMKTLCEDMHEVEISDFEVNQKDQVSTIDTVHYLYKQYKIDKLYVVIGADNLEKLSSWENYEELKAKVEFVILTRDGININNYSTITINKEISSTEIRENLDITSIPNKIQKKVKILWKIE